MYTIDLSPSTDHTAHLLLSDSEAILSRELYVELRRRGHTAGESAKIVHQHNGDTPQHALFADRFRRS